MLIFHTSFVVKNMNCQQRWNCDEWRLKSIESMEICVDVHAVVWYRDHWNNLRLHSILLILYRITSYYRRHESPSPVVVVVVSENPAKSLTGGWHLAKTCDVHSSAIPPETYDNYVKRHATPWSDCSSCFFSGSSSGLVSLTNSHFVVRPGV